MRSPMGADGAMAKKCPMCGSPMPAKKKVGAGQSTGTAEMPVLTSKTVPPVGGRKRKPTPTGVEGILRRRAIKGGAKGLGAD